MRYHNDPPAAQVPPLCPQSPQQQLLPSASWPSYLPPVVFNTWTTPFYYPAMSSMSPQPLPQSHGSVPENQPPWFQKLVEAVLNEVKEKSGKRDVNERNAMSVEDEKRLVEALKKQRDGGVTMLDMFEELSEKNGHSEAVWKTWFIENYESLESKVIHDRHRPKDSSDSRHRRSPTGVSTRIQKVSSKTSSEGQKARSTSHADLDDDASPRRAMKDARAKTAPVRTRVRSRAGKYAVRVTSADLRAMALYRFENDDDAEVRRYGRARWREFAARPENHKRTLDAWLCIPRAHPRHAAAIDQYVEELRKEAEAVKCTMSFGKTALKVAADLADVGDKSGGKGGNKVTAEIK